MLNIYAAVGQLETDPKLFKTGTGKECYRFTLVVPGNKSSDGKTHSDRIPCMAWGKAGQTAKYLEAGDVIAITGPINTSAYQKEGQWVNTWEVNILKIDFINKTQQKQQAAEPAPTAPQKYQPQNYGGFIPSQGAPQAPEPPPMPTEPPPPAYEETMPFDLPFPY